MFWGIATGVLLAAAILVVWPLVGAAPRWKAIAAVLVLAVPLAAAWLYHGVGTPAALDAAARQPQPQHMNAGNMAELADRLKQRLEQSPDNAEGWVLLGRTYKSLQRYPEALDALETAARLAPDQPVVTVELVEARLFASGNPQITPEMVAQLEQAVEREPALQKGYWLLGIAAAQRGDDREAIRWWQSLLQQVEPGSGIAEAVSAQIADARARLGEPVEMPVPAAGVAAAAPPPSAAADGGTPPSAADRMQLNVEITLADGAREALASAPAEAALFVIVRPAGENGGPPLGVRRVNDLQFPVALTLSDADSMIPQRPISSAGNVEVQARLSMAGRPLPASGDWQSDSTPAGGTNQTLQLRLDQRVP